MKGILLAGGLGKRLYPLTKSVSKQLLPIYDKPMIYYSLSILMIAGIREIILISTPKDLQNYKKLLGNGNDLGIKIIYEQKEEANGIEQSFLIAEKHILNSRVCLILGDNIFYGQGLKSKLDAARTRVSGATVFSYKVRNPKDFGVAKLDKSNNVIKIIEKPKKLISSYAVTGLYFYNSDICNIAKKLKPSDRGELEITDLNNLYIKKNKLKAHFLGRGFSWYDTGTFENLLEASINIRNLETRQDIRIGLIDEIVSRYRTTYFQHIYSSSYSAGYYSYIWAAVLDSDAFSRFKNSGEIFNKDLAEKYRKYILEKGGTEDPMELYRSFAGSNPEISALLNDRGLN